MKNSLHIAIVGAGIAGLSSALALLKSGYQVQIFEKKNELAELGAGLQLSANATHILNEWGILETIKKNAFKPNGIRFSHWLTGKTIADFPLNHRTQETPYLHIHRADLYNCLLNAVLKISPNCVHSDAEIIAIKNSSKACEFTYQNSNGEINSTVVDWLIGADGIHSICKSEIIGKQNQAHFTGNIAWRGIIPINKLKQKPEPKAHLVMAPNSHLVFYYIKGGEFLNYIAIKESNTFKTESWTEKGQLNELLKDFKDWHSDYTDILAQSDADNCYRWALHDRNSLNTWSKDRCIILGDAAHPVLPFLAQGAAMAIEDAQALSYCFQNHKENIANEFYKLRAERCHKVLETSRNNMHIYHESNFIKRFIRDIGVYFLSKVYPEFLNKKLDWLYNYKL
jgi:salicylate hydroxylase